jgi:hypothetical protein
MNDWIKVARYQLMARETQWIPWGALALSFAINLVIFAVVPSGSVPNPRTWGLATIYCFFFVVGVFSATRMLPFALALGLSRRAYWLGSALLALGLAALDAVALTVLQVLERATGGWGERINFFRVAWLLDGSWYLTLLTSFVALVFMFVYGSWFGLVYRRWNLFGLLAFGTGQGSVVAAAALITTWLHGWSDVGHFFVTLSVAGLTGVVAVLAAVLLAGGFTTLRRVTV